MTSHTHLYAKLDEFGKDFNAVIKKHVSDECQYLAAHQSNATTLVEQSTQEPGISSLEQSQPQQHTTSLQGMTPEPTFISSRQMMQHQPITGTSSEQVLCEPTPVLSQLMQSMPTTCTSSGQVHREPDPVSSGQTQVVLQPDKGRKITFDNFDIYQEVHHMTEQNQNKDKHYVTVMSTENRVSGSHLRRDGPICDIAGLENGKCVPDHNDHLMQKNDYVVLVARIITANIQCLKHLDEVVTKHIRHRYQKETAQATDTVSYFLNYVE